MYEIDFGRQVKSTILHGISYHLRVLTDKLIVVRFVDLKPKSDFAPSMFIVGSIFMVGRNLIDLIAPICFAHHDPASSRHPFIFHNYKTLEDASAAA